MGVFVAYANFIDPLCGKDDTVWAEVYRYTDAVELAEGVDAKWFTVVPGAVAQQFKDGEKWNRYGGGRDAEGYQAANVVELLRRCSEILEPHKLTMVLEPLNWHTNHGGTFLQRSDQAYLICRAVNSPACKILFDIYHQQITEGNLINNIDKSWNEIAYFQAGDNPGRKEPGTGEINYRNVFRHIHARSQATERDFVIGMEHGLSTKGKRVVKSSKPIEMLIIFNSPRISPLTGYFIPTFHHKSQNPPAIMKFHYLLILLLVCMEIFLPSPSDPIFFGFTLRTSRLVQLLWG